MAQAENDTAQPARSLVLSRLPVKSSAANNSANAVIH